MGHSSASMAIHRIVLDRTRALPQLCNNKTNGMILRKLPALLFTVLLLGFSQSLLAQKSTDQIAIIITSNDGAEITPRFFPSETQVMIDGLDGQYATIIDRPQGPDEYRGTFLITLQLPEDSRVVQIPITNGKALFFEQAESAQTYFQAQDSGQ